MACQRMPDGCESLPHGGFSKTKPTDRGLGRETSVRILNYSRHEWQDGHKSKTKHHHIKEHVHERSSDKQTWHDAITEVMGSVVVVVEITGECLTVHHKTAFERTEKHQRTRRPQREPIGSLFCP